MENKLKNIGSIFLIIILVIVLVALLIGIKFLNNNDAENNNEELQIVKESTNIDVEFTTDELVTEYEGEYTAKITLSDNGISVEGSGVTKSERTVTITKAGTYYITGTISDGNIVVNADKSDDVILILDNCNITSKTTAPINGVKCGKLTINLAENSKNTVTDSSSYLTFTDTEKEEPDAAIFTKTDLIINGSGSLTVNANYNDAIASKDGLKIINANITINSTDDGIRGKDYVAINNANLTIKAEGDGIKTTNDTDTTLGYIVIEGGSINITAGADGVQAETVINISEDAVVNIKTQGEISSSNKNQGFGWQMQTTSSSTDSSSSKGLKAGTEITIKSGTINITSTDDAIHSNGIILINGGTYVISAGDDGIHADTNIVINNGTINIAKSYEGIESSYIEINGGEISVVASDDGINVAGGNDSSSVNGRMGQNMFTSTASSNNKLVINGGNITVNSTGDGLDANGSLYVNGGTIVVIGPTSSGNGPLDYDGEFVVTGGNLIVYGSTGMWQNPSTNSTQYSLTFGVSGKASDEVVLKNSSGNTIVSFTAQKSYGAILISNANLQKGETYTLYVNGTSAGSITVSSVVNSNGNFGGMQGGMGGMSSGMQNGNQGQMPNSGQNQGRGRGF